MHHLTQYHLEKDLQLPKVTLQRWLRERLSHPEDEPRWRKASALLGRWSRRYTAREVRELLKLGTARYRGFRGMTPAVKRGLQSHIISERRAIVQRVTQILSHA
jgi:hypothetical protein